MKDILSGASTFNSQQSTAQGLADILVGNVVISEVRAERTTRPYQYRAVQDKQYCDCTTHLYARLHAAAASLRGGK